MTYHTTRKWLATLITLSLFCLAGQDCLGQAPARDLGKTPAQMSSAFNKSAKRAGIDVELAQYKHPPLDKDYDIATFYDRRDPRRAFTVSMIVDKKTNRVREMIIFFKPDNEPDIYESSLLYYVLVSTLSPKLGDEAVVDLLDELGVPGDNGSLVLNQVNYSYVIVPRGTLIGNNDVGGAYFSARALGAPKLSFPKYPEPKGQARPPAVEEPDQPKYSI